MEALKLQRNINYGSTLPLIVFIAGMLVIYLFSSDLYGEGMLSLLICATLYLAMILIRSTDINPPTEYNLILENISTFLAFGIAPIVFGIKFYAPNTELGLILLIYFFSIATVLSMARNWDFDPRESLGLPIAFNGIFMPLFYYMFKFYFQNPGNSIFLIYFFLASILTLSNYKFLWFDERFIKRKHLIKDDIEDLLVKKRLEEREIKNQNQNKKENKQQETKKSENKKNKPDILEESNLEKIIRFFKNFTKKSDNFNTIKEMPTKQELNETLPHTQERKENLNKLLTKPKKKKKAYQKIIKFIYNKLNKNKISKQQWNTIKNMPTEKEIKETLTQTNKNKKEEIKLEQKKEIENLPTKKETEKTPTQTNSNKITTKEENWNTPIEIPTQNKPKQEKTNIKPEIKKETIIIDNEEFDLGEFEDDYTK